MVNLLVGPLAEAKYVSIRDNEIFNLNIVNFESLRNYGGFNDLKMVEEYPQAFIASKPHREEILHQLLKQAFEFIDNPMNWSCIQNLAEYILESGQEIISCNEAIYLLDKCLSNSASFISEKID